MGLRGVGAAERTKVAALATNKKMPWEKESLKRHEKVIAFLQYLPITKGILAGKKLKLLPDQRAFIEELYAEDSTYKIGVFSQPRGNGKTGLTAGLTLCHLIGPEAEFRGACYSAAIDRKQAGLIADEMEAMVMQVPEFAAVVNFKRFPYRMIEVTGGAGIGSIYEALSADGRRGHGLSPTFWVYDELAQAKNRELLDSLTTSMGKRKRTLAIVISTQAADNEHPLSELIDYGLRKIDKSLLVHLRSAPMDADPFSPETIRAVNPALGTFLSAEDIFAEALRAREMPAFESSFRNTRLNQRIAVDLESMFLTPEVWERNAGAIDYNLFTDGRPVWGALDLSSSIDLTAFVLGCDDDDGNRHLWPFAWTPGDTIHERALKDRAPYDAWVRSGDLRITPGPVIDYDWLAYELAEIISPIRNFRKLVFDAWKIRHLREAFDRIGFWPPMEEFEQRIKPFSEAVESFRTMAHAGTLRHGGHQVLRWCVGNTELVKDAMNNCKPDKARSNGRIDLAVAAIMLMKPMARRDFDVTAMIA